jgi:hypothetical protein
MNEISGYYSCSINPSYISTWYTSFKSRRKFDHTPRLFPEEPYQVAESTLENPELTGWEDFPVTPPVNQIPANR